MLIMLLFKYRRLLIRVIWFILQGRNDIFDQKIGILLLSLSQLVHDWVKIRASHSNQMEYSSCNSRWHSTGGRRMTQMASEADTGSIWTAFAEDWSGSFAPFGLDKNQKLRIQRKLLSWLCRTFPLAKSKLRRRRTLWRRKHKLKGPHFYWVYKSGRFVCYISTSRIRINLDKRDWI